MPSLTKLNRSAATLTKNRTEGSVSPFSGMCVTCVDGCIGMCEIGKSAYRGHEVIYPAALRRHHHGAARRTIPSTTRTSTSWARPSAPTASRPTATRPSSRTVNLEITIGHDKGIKFRCP